MAFEVIRGEDCRIVLSHLKQSAYGTRLTDGNLDSGKSIRLNTAVLGEIQLQRAAEGPRPMQGDEFNRGDRERDIARDSGIALALDADSWMAAWAATFLLGSISSVQEGATTHYTHTIRPTDPLASGQVRQALVTSIYVDSNGPDSGRLRRVLQDLAIASLTISGASRQMVQMAVELIGSGQEVKDPTISIPTLASLQDFSGQGVTLEYGNKGAGLTDISERLREWSVRLNQNLAADHGYYPGSGKYRGRIWFVNRTFSIDLALWANRANRDLMDDMLDMTRKEIKLTIDSGVLAGTSSTTNHQIIIRFPDVRLSEAPLSVENEGSIYGTRVAENQVYKDTSIADSPVTVTVDNDQVSYLT